jgi:septum formation inhibitor MinC
LQSVLDKIRAAGLVPQITVAAYMDEEEDAFAMERDLIAQYGRRDLRTGSLCNLTGGGQGTAGLKYSEERLRKKREQCSTPEWREMMTKIIKKAWQNPEHRQRILESQNRLRNDPAYRARLRAAILKSRTEEVRNRISVVMRENWESEEYRAKQAASRAEAHARPEEKKRKSEATKRLWTQKGDSIRLAIKAAKSTPERRAEASKKSKAYYESEEARKQAGEYSRAYNTPEVRAAKAELLKARWADPEFRAKMLAKRKAKAQGV